jgi:dihydrofolate reductase
MCEKNLELIWAQSSNNIIGLNGTMPWHIKEDLQYFKKITTGKSVIMGKNTWKSLYIKPLPNRENIILTSKPSKFSFNSTPKQHSFNNSNFDEFSKENSSKYINKQIHTHSNQLKAPIIVSSIKDAVAKATLTPIVIGGKKTYDSAIEYANTLFVTVINKECKGDTTAPKINEKHFKLIDNKIVYTKDKIKLEFRIYGSK